MKKKTVLHVIEAFASGALNFLINLTSNQIKDYNIYVLYGIRPLTPDNVESLFDRRIHLVRAKHFHGALGTVLNPLAYEEVRHYCNLIKPDYVHLHSSSAGFVGRWCLNCHNVKVFYTPHGFAFLQHDLSSLYKPFYKLMEYVSAKCGATIIACGQSEYRIARKMTDKVKLVPNGINISDMQKYSVTIRQLHRPLRVCACGRICSQKNPKLFNKIAELLPRTEFTWIGGGDAANELISSNIKVTGWVDRKEMLEYFNYNDIYILTTFGEGLPLSLLEAMYMGLPCLASKVRGCVDVISNGINGYLCSTAKEFVDRIKTLIDDREIYSKISLSGKKLIENNYTLDIMSQNYKKTYEAADLEGKED